MIRAVRLGRLIEMVICWGTNGAVRIGDEGYGAAKGLIVPLQVVEAGAEEVGEELDGDVAGLGLLAAVASHETGQALAGLRDDGQGDGELLELAGVGAVLEGVEVAPGGAGAGAAAATTMGRGVLRLLVGHGKGMVGQMFYKWKGKVSGGGGRNLRT